MLSFVIFLICIESVTSSHDLASVGGGVRDMGEGAKQVSVLASTNKKSFRNILFVALKLHFPIPHHVLML